MKRCFGTTGDSPRPLLPRIHGCVPATAFTEWWGSQFEFRPPLVRPVCYI